MPNSIEEQLILNEQLMLALFSESVDLEQLNQLIAKGANANSIFRINMKFGNFRPTRFDESKGCEVVDCYFTQVDSSNRKHSILSPTRECSFFSNSKILNIFYNICGYLGPNVAFSTPLHLALLRGDVELVHVLITKETDLNQKINGLSPLDAAIRMGEDMASLNLLIRNGAKINCLCKVTTLYLAAERGYYLSFLKLSTIMLPEFFEDIDNLNSLFICAILGGNSEIVKILIDQGANYNFDSGKGTTPLHVAARSTKKDAIKIVKVLLDKGADVNVLKVDGQTPLAFAVKAGNSEIVKILLDKGADVNIPEVDGRTPLAIAVEAGNSKIVNLLLKHGADANVCDYEGNSLINNAIKKKKTDIASLLVIHDAVLPEQRVNYIEDKEKWKNRMSSHICLFSNFVNVVGEEQFQSSNIVELKNNLGLSFLYF